MSIRASLAGGHARLKSLLLSPAARPLRFICIGGLAAAIQLTLLALLTAHQWQPDLADTVAFLLAAQVNFACSARFTWGDRTRSHPLWRRWAVFHASIIGTALLNLLIFTLARHVFAPLVASMLGIAAAATGNFLIGDRLVFRPVLTLTSTTPDQEQAA